MEEVNLYKKFFDLEKLTAKIIAYDEHFDEKLFLKAYLIAEKAHRGQLRKDLQTPYIAHPVATANILADIFADQDVLISALLHDVVEDTDFSLKDINEAFGEKVAFLVDGVTKLSKVKYNKGLHGNNIESLKKLFFHTVQDPRVILIKLADRLHNMKTLGVLTENRRLQIAAETLDIYVPIANLLGIQKLKKELEDLCFEHLMPKEFGDLLSKVEVIQKIQKKTIHKTISSIKHLLKDNKVSFEIGQKNFSFFSIYRRYANTDPGLHHFSKIFKLMITVKKQEDCYLVLGLIHSRFKPQNNRLRDYIANPKFNGYKSLHTTVFGPQGYSIEIQINTEQMLFDIDYGISAQFFRNKNNSIKDKRSEWFKTLLELEGTEAQKDDFMDKLRSDILEEKIMVFTPNGDTIDLPEGSSAIDFAYAIHSDIGHSALKAEINGKTGNITKILKTGDVVKIYKDPSVQPRLSWLAFAKTGNAQTKIKEFLRKESYEARRNQGLELLQKELDFAGLGFYRDLNFKKLQQQLVDNCGLTYESWEDVIISIGDGELDAMKVVKMFTISEKKEHKLIKATFEIVARNRFGLLGDIAKIFYCHSSDMYDLAAKTSFSKKEGFFLVRVEVQNFEKIMRIYAELEQTEGVKSVKRVHNTADFALKTMILLVLSLILIFIYTQDAILSLGGKSITEKLEIFIGASVLLAMIFGLNRLLKTYMPSLRHSKWFDFFAKIIPMAMVFILIGEFIYFKIEISSPLLLITITSACVITGSYLVSRKAN